MKTISATTKKVTLIVGLLMASLILLVFNSQAANGIDYEKDYERDPEKDLRYKTEIVKIEKAAKAFNSFKELKKDYENPEHLLKFFDENENLVYEVSITPTMELTDTKLVGYLHQSDLVMKLNKTSFYRFSK